MKLYIIGNGFDLYHKLPTGTDDFCKIIEDIDCNEYYLTAGVDWSLYEEALSSFDVDEMAKQFVGYPDYASDHEYDRDGVILNMEERMSAMLDIVRRGLNEMIEKAEAKIDGMFSEEDEADSVVEKNTVFADDSIFLSFNYTSILEKLYGIHPRRVLHIHGYYENDAQLVFGYAEHSKNVLKTLAYSGASVPGFRRKFDEMDEVDFYVQKQYDAMYEFYNANKKELQLENLLNWIKPYIGGIDEIVVLGHSFGKVDKPYFDLIESLILPSKWIVSQFNGNPDLTQMQMHSFAHKEEFCKITDYVSGA